MQFRFTKKQFPPFVLGLAAGLYPILFYYSQNYYLINTGRHLLFFGALFLGAPIVLFILARFILKSKSEVFQERIFTFLSLSCFGIFLQLCLYARLQWLFTLVTLVIAFVVAKYLYRQLRRVVVLQFLMAGVALLFALPVLVNQLHYSETWMEQPDAIESVVFKKTPNIYLIQPDGYVSFSELDKGLYDIDNTAFEGFLKKKNFRSYPHARSNYSTTLTSNASLFGMKHHYYNFGYNFSERLDARRVILADNPVLGILKNNKYRTHYLTEWPYMLVNNSEMGYDYCNFSADEIPLMTQGFDAYKDVLPSLMSEIDKHQDQPRFFFIELFQPGHIATNKIESAGVAQEKLWWITKLKEANVKLEAVVQLIHEKDPDALVVILADHGGYVGLEYMRALLEKTQDRDELYSAFSALLAIKWPENNPPKFDAKLKTNVNLFRILMAYLGEDEAYLEHLQDDGSYHIVNRKAPKGVYKYIDAAGKIVFERQN